MRSKPLAAGIRAAISPTAPAAATKSSPRLQTPRPNCVQNYPLPRIGFVSQTENWLRSANRNWLRSAHPAVPRPLAPGLPPVLAPPAFLRHLDHHGGCGGRVVPHLV